MDETILELDVLDGGFSKEEESLLYKELGKVEGIQQYLKSTLAQDIKRYFLSPKESQEFIKGQYNRTRYIYDKILKSIELTNK